MAKEQYQQLQKSEQSSNWKERPWAETYETLDAIDRSEYWRCSGCSSFTDWVNKHYCRFGVKPPMLWRILAAGRYLKKIKPVLLVHSVVVPDTEEIPKDLSPENVELLSKLERVLPSDRFIEIARKLFSGEAKRSDLRYLWQTYRPVLQGKTARGGTAPTITIVKQLSENKELLAEAILLDQLKVAVHRWFKADSQIAYRFFWHVHIDGYSPDNHLFPAVVMVKSKLESPAQYHAFRFANEQPWAEVLPYADFCWAILKGDDNDTECPLGVGIIKIVNKTVVVVKPADKVEQAGVRRDQLISALLLRSVKN